MPQLHQSYDFLLYRIHREIPQGKGHPGKRLIILSPPRKNSYPQLARAAIYVEAQCCVTIYVIRRYNRTQNIKAVCLVDRIRNVFSFNLFEFLKCYVLPHEQCMYGMCSLWNLF